MSDPLAILVTNDDGLQAAGLPPLLAALQPLARLYVAVPREEMSGIGHAVTLHRTLRASPVALSPAAAALAVEGTPADAVKLALTTVFRGTPFALVVSGVNRGPNVGVNVLYSGTVGAGLEAVIAGLPALAVSLDAGASYDFAPAAAVAARLAGRLLARRARGALPARLINVNVPNGLEPLGLRLTRQGTSGFVEYYLPEPPGAAGAWRIEGEMRLREASLEYDAAALRAGYVAVTPLGLDLTDRAFAAADGAWNFLLE